MALKEQWKDVVGYEGYYQISNLGRVKSVDRVVPHMNRKLKLKSKLLHPSARKRDGYLEVALNKKGFQRTIQVHKLVAFAWLGPCPNGLEVCHGSTDITDNSISNLSYDTHSQNLLHRRQDGTHGGRPVKRSDGIEFINMTVAAEAIGGDRRGVWDACNGRCKTTHGYSFEYV